MRKVLLFVTACVFSGAAVAQDFHFSQFFASPMSLNPAMTGAAKKDIRLAANYRSQWGWSSAITPFQTFGASIDAGTMRRVLPGGDFVGIGMSFFSDQAGDAKFGSRQFSGFLAYHKELSKSVPQFLSIGLQASYNQVGFGINPLTALYFDSQYDPTFTNNYNPDGSLSGETWINGAATKSVVDFSAGILWYGQLNQNLNLYFGAGLAHLTEPPIQFLSTTLNPDDARIFRKVTVHGGGQIDLNNQVALVPTFIFLKQGPATEFNIGTFTKFSLGKLGDYEAAWSIGGWYRFGDAVIPATRIDYANFSLGFSYDLNVSSLIEASNLAGGPELAVTYEFNGPGGKVGTGKVLCPRF